MTRHRFDPFSFITGAVAVGLAVAVLSGQVSVSLVDLRVAGPILVLVLGISLLLGSGRDRASGGGADPTADPTADRTTEATTETAAEDDATDAARD